MRQALHLLAILSIDAWTVSELALALGLHRRTIYRYLDAFRALGLPIIEEAAPGAISGYRLDATHWHVAWLRSQGIDTLAHQHRRAARAHKRRRSTTQEH